MSNSDHVIDEHSVYLRTGENSSGAAASGGARGRTGLLILNFGGPETVAEVQSFLFNLFNDPEVIRLPWGRAFQGWLAGVISRRRAPVTAAQYKLIGGGSPLNAMTFAQVAALKACLPSKLEGPVPPVYVAMRYSQPTTAQALEQLRADGVTSVVALALYPHFSFTTTGSSFRQLREELVRMKMSLEVRFIPAWYQEPGYLGAMADLIAQGLEKFPTREAVHILFSAHGLPVSYIRRGDPYQRQVQESVRAIVRTLGWEGHWSLAYQSQVGRMRWLGPRVEPALTRLAERGHRAVLVVPVSFVGDHIETLYEIDDLFAAHAREVGIEAFHRPPPLDTHPRFVDALATVVARALEGPVRRRCVRCLLPKDEAFFTQKVCGDCGHHIPPYFGC